MGKSITDLSSVTTVGLDLAKHVFQVHGVDASGRVVVAKAIRRAVLAILARAPPYRCPHCSRTLPRRLVDGARAASGSMKGRAKMVVVRATV